ncbi:dihydroneopterin triphosphate diphosphatase [Chromobacterium sp. IIBBL 290-4]|uniref:dihydroneopterin triphosphate diphosphatase n=1 Tax=Chromobacterium sp. IIBBL 290-4 TaxID=2953890 RepID=UPI0020B872BB|nr:dihydroneopterin triphosphate diphosphatase [Chromobacterium sp. IIBBL 290-4]UTH73377.1 dihydroneopterin triphosphate diphosphatase [Chromobacterium sp. IIBBL 290-4]
MGNKQPVSVLVVIHSRDGQVLLLERADKPGYWQSVTGSREGSEDLLETARREVMEETGLDASRFELSDWRQVNRYEIYPHWRHRYPEGVTHNDEHVFGLQLPQPCEVELAPREHLGYCWLPWAQAAEKVFSPSNAEALRLLPQKLGLALG